MHRGLVLWEQIAHPLSARLGENFIYFFIQYFLIICHLIVLPLTAIYSRAPCLKARKSFHCVLPCLVMMYHQTNLGCQTFSICKELVETIVALTLNTATLYFWIILWLMMMHHHTSLTDQRYCSGKQSLKFRTFTMTLTYSKATFSQGTPTYEHALSNLHCDLEIQQGTNHKTLQLMNMHCQHALLVAPKISSSEHRNSHIKFIVWTEIQLLWFHLENRNPFFANDWLMMSIAILGLVKNGSVMHNVSSKLALTET